jgi:hypothetical protein
MHVNKGFFNPKPKAKPLDVYKICPEEGQNEDCKNHFHFLGIVTSFEAFELLIFFFLFSNNFI